MQPRWQGLLPSPQEQELPARVASEDVGTACGSANSQTRLGLLFWEWAYGG